MMSSETAFCILRNSFVGLFTDPGLGDDHGYELQVVNGYGK